MPHQMIPIETHFDLGFLTARTVSHTLPEASENTVQVVPYEHSEFQAGLGWTGMGWHGLDWDEIGWVGVVMGWVISLLAMRESVCLSLSPGR